MIATNVLLTIALSIVANFTNVVPVRDAPVPTTTNDLEKYIIGSPSSPTDVVLFCKKGVMFVISDGVVVDYRRTGSFFNLQDPALIPEFFGTSKLNSNQVVELATKVIRGLIKRGNPLTNGPPRVIDAGFDRKDPTKRIPFYWVQFPSGNETVSTAADVEIDGRTGTIVRLDLMDRGFRDIPASGAINAKVYTPEPVTKKPYVSLVRKFQLHQPTTNDVAHGIASCLDLCRRLGINPGSDTNIVDLNWDETLLRTNPIISAKSPVCAVMFRGGGGFATFDGIVFSYVADDACFTGDWEQRQRDNWAPFNGKILKRWDDLATNLQKVLVEKVGLPKEPLNTLRALPQFMPPALGTEGVKRVLLEWRNWPAFAGRAVSIQETTLAFMAEFDLETGELKSIDFWDPKLIELLGKAQSKSQ